MTDLVWEDYWAVSHPDDGPARGGFYFVLRLLTLSEEDTATMRDQAQGILSKQGDTEREIVQQTFTAIRDLCQRRIDRTAPGNVVLCFIQPHPTDPWEAIYDDRARTIHLAHLFEEGASGKLADAWRGVAHGFDLMQFSPPR